MEKISMRYTKEKSLKSRRPNEKASEMKGRIARGLLSVALVGVLTTIMPFNANANSSNVYYLGEAVNAGKDTGFSENNEITKKDPHYNWTLGSFSVNGYTRVITDDGNPIFLKTVGDEVVLIGKDGEEEITMEAIGKLSGRFNYEFACDLGKRIPRVYDYKGRITGRKDYFEE